MFYLDIPTLDCLLGDDEHWLNIAIFKNKADALAFIRGTFGPCDDDGNLQLLTEGTWQFDDEETVVFGSTVQETLTEDEMDKLIAKLSSTPTENISDLE